VAGNAAYLGDRWGLYVIDVTNPTSPHRIGSWGSAIEQVEARGHLCYVTTFNPNEPGDITFHVLDVAVPSLPYQIGSLGSAGGNDVFLVDTLAFGAGDGDFNKLTVISVADSTEPRLIGSAATRGWSMGIWASGLAQATFVGCHWEGLQVYDTRNTSQPVRDTFLLGADEAVDVCVDNDRAYVANEMAGLWILDVSDPARPTPLGSYDTTYQMPAMTTVVARDSFAFVDWFWFRVMDVSIPSRPVMAGGCETFNPLEDMVLRDSFVYCAEANRFQVVNVARPREPVLVGSCVLPGTPGKLVLYNSTAYAATHGVQCVSIADPDSPFVVGTYGTEVTGLDMVDTVIYGAGPYTGIIALSVANPAAPRLLDSLYLTDTLWWNDVVVVDSLAYVAGERIWVVDATDPGNLRLIPGVTWTPPYLVRRLLYAPPYVYAACYEAGICVLETASTAVAEQSPPPTRLTALTVTPSIVAGRALVRIEGVVGQIRITVYDAAGRAMRALRLTKTGSDRTLVDLPIAELPPGVYVVRATWMGGACSQKIVKQTRRR